MWYETNVSYKRQGDMGLKSTRERYLISAEGVSDAEARIIKTITPYVSYGDIEILSIKEVKIADVICSDVGCAMRVNLLTVAEEVHTFGAEDDRYYRAKLGEIVLNEQNGKEKLSTCTAVVKAPNFWEAVDALRKHLSGVLTDFQVLSLVEMPICDIIH